MQEKESRALCIMIILSETGETLQKDLKVFSSPKEDYSGVP